MEQWSVRDDDRPFVRQQRSAEFWVPALAVIAVVAAAAFYYYLQRAHELPFSPPPPAQGAAAPQPAPAAPPAPEPAIQHPLETAAQAPAPSLPTLENSDSMMRDSVAHLIGRKAFAEAVIPQQLVRRIVATIDNLPRPTAPQRMMPLQPVPGAFAALGGNDDGSIDPANYARYTPYVRVLQSVDAHALVQRYVRAYPLFQRAYEELGFPGKYFNDRLLQAIDDMLATPEIDGTIHVVRPKVLYQFADPDLETRSAGQKILLRMGAENAARVKAKLTEIRRELVAAGKKG
jgi:hypothetical protein